MEEIKTNNVKWGVEVLIIFLLAALAIGASVGCFNYATLAKAEGNPDNFFWFIGIANILWNGFVIYRRVKKLRESDI